MCGANMRVPLFLLAFFWSCCLVSAGGFQGCLERIWAFQAYELDELNPPENRNLGYKCSLWDFPSKTCAGSWIPCSGTAHGGRCTYDEFIGSLGRTNGLTNWGVYHPGTNNFDIDASARRCKEYYSTIGRGKVPNFPAFHVLKYANGDFNRYTERLSRIMDDTWRAHGHANNRARFTLLDATRNRIMVIRDADHGKQLIDPARTRLGGEMTVVITDFGQDPMHPNDPNQRLLAFDFRGTALAARAAGVPNYVEKLRLFANYMYHGGHPQSGIARKHLAMNRVYRKSKDDSIACRGR